MLRCRYCQIESPRQEGFVATHDIWEGHCDLCLACYQFRKTYSSYYWSCAVWVAFLLTLGLLLGHSIVASILLALLMHFLVYLTVVIHECGHFLAAVATRLSVPAMSFGDERRSIILRCRNLFLTFSLCPSVGQIIVIPRPVPMLRLRIVLIFLAGPATNLLGLWLGFHVMAHYQPLLPTVVSDSVIAWIVVNALTAIFNLVPWTITAPDGEFMSDGAQVLSVGRLEHTSIEMAETEQTAWRVHYLYLAGQLKLALLAAYPLLMRHQCPFFVKELAVAACLDSGEVSMGYDWCRETLLSDHLSASERARMEAKMAYILLFRGDRESLAYAMHLNDEAAKVIPWDLTVRAIEGIICIKKGEVEVGIELLTDRRFRLLSKQLQADIHAWRAIGLARLGRFDDANKALSQAQSFNASGPHIEEATTLLTSATKS